MHYVMNTSGSLVQDFKKYLSLNIENWALKEEVFTGLIWMSTLARWIIFYMKIVK